MSSPATSLLSGTIESDACQNPFADHILKRIQSFQVMDSIRECAWDEKNEALLIMLQPEVPEYLEELKQVIVERFREMVTEPEFRYRIRIDAQENIVLGGIQTLFLKIHNLGDIPPDEIED